MLQQLSLTLIVQAGSGNLNLDSLNENTFFKPQIAIIKEGKRAPFSGVLYNNIAFANSRANHLSEIEKLNNRTSRDLKLLENKLKTITSTWTIAYDSLQERCDFKSSSQDKEINNLIKTLENADKQINEQHTRLTSGIHFLEKIFWFSLGVGAVILGAWAINEVEDSNEG